MKLDPVKIDLRSTLGLPPGPLGNCLWGAFSSTASCACSPHAMSSSSLMVPPAPHIVFRCCTNLFPHAPKAPRELLVRGGGGDLLPLRLLSPCHALIITLGPACKPIYCFLLCLFAYFDQPGLALSPLKMFVRSILLHSCCASLIVPPALHSSLFLVFVPLTSLFLTFCSTCLPSEGTACQGGFPHRRLNCSSQVMSLLLLLLLPLFPDCHADTL